MDDNAVFELVYAKHHATPGLGPLVVLVLVLGMLLLAYVFVVVERKVRRGDFDPLPPEMFRLKPVRGFPVIMRQERHPPYD